MGDIGWQELLIIFVILLLLFGATRLPALSKSLGQSIRGFKQGLKDDEPGRRRRRRDDEAGGESRGAGADRPRRALRRSGSASRP